MKKTLKKSTCGIFLVILINLFKESDTSSLSIQLENGYYTGILIAIDDQVVSQNDCSKIIENLQTNLLPLFSTKLHQATNGLAALGPVSILLPQAWSYSSCGIRNASYVSPAEPIHSLDNSHFKITSNHPLTSDDALPWTKQYKPCGQPNDHIILPLKFLTETSLQNSIKAQLLVHEWMKFRHGVFDEFGYESSPKLPACYQFEKQGSLSSCSNSPSISAVALDASACNLEFLANIQSKLVTTLSQGTSSLMSVPYLDSVEHLCNQSTHNPWAPTKQNLHCNRQSVAEVVFSHPDFTNAPISRQNPVPPELKIIRHSRKFSPGYAFILDLSLNSQNSFKLQQVKQAIAQFFEILQTGTEVYLALYSEESEITNWDTALTDQNKAEFLSNILNLAISQPQNQTRNISLNLVPVINHVIAELAKRQTVSWNVFLFSDDVTSANPISDMPEAIKAFEATPHFISIFTFDNTAANTPWLEWNTVQNTKNVIALPYCFIANSGGPCSLLTESYILDHFISTLNQQQYEPRFLQNPVGSLVIQNRAGNKVPFEIPSVGTIQRFYVFLNLPENTISNSNAQTYLKLVGPSGQTCQISQLLGYSLVLKFNCVRASGTWTLEVISGVPSTPQTTPFVLQAYLEAQPGIRFTVGYSLGIPDISQEISQNTSLVPVYVSVQTPTDQPILNAKVKISLIPVSTYQTNEISTEITLKDNGETGSVDQTENDGIYSAYLTGFSKVGPTFHLLQIQVSTDSETKILKKIQPSKAILMDNRLQAKCCGDKIVALETSPFTSGVKFQMLHFGVKTKDAWAQTKVPPTQIIGPISATEINDTEIQVKFDAVLASPTLEPGVIVTSYQACCVPLVVVNPVAPGENSCKPESAQCYPISNPGSVQICTISKETLVKLWIAPDNIKATQLSCGLQAVNSKSELGPISQQFFEVDISSALEAWQNELKSCDTFSLKDKCLPLWILWVVIGCLGALLLVIIIFAICCCVCLRRRKKAENSVQEKLPKTKEATSVQTEEREETEPKVVNELFINHAYIQDDDGDVKIIANNGQILRRPKEENMTPRNLASPALSQNQKQVQIDPNPQNMQIFKPEPTPKPNRENTRRQAKTRRPEIIHANPMLPQSDSAYEIAQSPMTSPVSTPQHFVDPALVYASISRSGRLKPIPVANSRQMRYDPPYSVPQNTVSNRMPTQMSPRRPGTSQQALIQPHDIPHFPGTVTESGSSSDPEDKRVPQRFKNTSNYPTGSPVQFSAPPPVPVPPPRFDRRTVTSPPVVNQTRVATFSPTRQPVRNVENHNEDDDSDDWDDGDNTFELDYTTGISHA